MPLQHIAYGRPFGSCFKPNFQYNCSMMNKDQVQVGVGVDCINEPTGAKTFVGIVHSIHDDGVCVRPLGPYGSGHPFFAWRNIRPQGTVTATVAHQMMRSCPVGLI